MALACPFVAGALAWRLTMVRHRHVLPVTDPRCAAGSNGSGISSNGNGDDSGSRQVGSGQPPGTAAAGGEVAGDAARAGAGEPPVNRQLLAWGLSQ